MWELATKDFKASIRKVLHETNENTLKTNENNESLSNKVKHIRTIWKPYDKKA